MNKKGEWTLLQTFTIIGGIVAAFLLISIVLRVGSQKDVEQVFYTKDTKLLIDTVVGSPQDLRVIYKGKSYIVIENDTVSYSDSQTPNERPEIINRNQKEIIDASLWSEPFFIIKRDDKIMISNNPSVIPEADR